MTFEITAYRRHLFSSVAAWLCIGALAFSLGACDNSKKRPLVLGAVLPMTGDAASFGQNAAKGAELAVSVAGEQGMLNNARFRLAVEDSRGNPADAAAAGRKLLDVDGAQLMIGDVTSAGTHALIPIITNAKVPLISPSASDPALSGASRYFARVWPSDVYEASVIGQHALEEGYGRIAIIYANTDYGVGMVKALRETVPADRIALDIPVERAVADFRPSLARAQLAVADAFFVVLYPEDGKRFLTQSAELGITLPILATATMEDPMVASAPGPQRLVFASPLPPDDSGATRAEFIKAYKSKFNAEPGVLSDTGYDAAMILLKTWAEVSDEGPEAVADAIRQLKNYPGVSGTMTFDANGDVRKPYGLKIVRDGTFIWVDHGA